MTSTYEDLAERAEAMAAEHRRVPSLDLVRAALNEAGLRKARSAMRDAPDLLAHAQEVLRTCQAVEAAAKDAYDAALAEASWLIDGQANFVVESNKTFLITDDEHRRPLTADQRRAWVSAEAAKQPAVANAATVLSGAVAETAAARDSVEVARLRCSIAKREVDAAVAELEALTYAIPKERNA